MRNVVEKIFAQAVLVAALVAACDEGNERSAPEERDAGSGRDEEDELVRPRRRLALSSTHSCALREAGLYCWGENFEGQLGTGDLTDSEVPVAAMVETADVVDLVASGGRTCVLRSSGRIACWGSNDHGEIGDGTREGATTPTETKGIDDAAAIAIADDSTCVLHEGGTVSCWGGSPSAAPESGSLLPRRVEGLSDIVELRGGTLGTYCVRDGSSEVRCFRFVDGAWTEPAPVSELAGARALAIPGHDEVCAIVPSSEILCHNLDSGSTDPLSDSERSVELLSTALVTCAKRDDGSFRCWNVLPPMLHGGGSPAIPLPSEPGTEELAIGGFRLCQWREGGEVACANAAELVPFPVVVEGLPR